MAHIVGIDNIQKDKILVVSLTYIYDFCSSLEHVLCKNVKNNENVRVKNLKEEDLNNIRNEIKKFHVEGDLSLDNAFNIKRLIEINCYRGINHKNILPVRGQKTKTNVALVND